MISSSADLERNFKRFVVRGKAFDVSTPLVMGILNVTPDSFSDGGLYQKPDEALRQIERMVKAGAQIIDIGGESTRPGSEMVSSNEEQRRVLPVIKQAVTQYPDIYFSIDTTKYEVAKVALDAGVHFINDVSGLQKEPRFTELCASYDAGLIIMHSKGEPKTMQKNPDYGDVVSEVAEFLEQACKKAEEDGVKTIITDPGIGFGKNLDHNLSLIRSLNQFTEIGYPVLLGASRKSMIGQITGREDPNDRLAGTLAMHYHGLMQGASILRVHDVQEAIDSILIYNAITQNLE